MSDDLTQTPQFNILYRLREYWSVPQPYVAEIERRLNRAKWQGDELEEARRRIKWLEQHVPPEILNPPAVQTKGVRFTGD